MRILRKYIVERNGSCVIANKMRRARPHASHIFNIKIDEYKKQTINMYMLHVYITITQIFEEDGIDIECYKIEIYSDALDTTATIYTYDSRSANVVDRVYRTLLEGIHF